MFEHITAQLDKAEALIEEALALSNDETGKRQKGVLAVREADHALTDIDNWNVNLPAGADELAALEARAKALKIRVGIEILGLNPAILASMVADL